MIARKLLDPLNLTKTRAFYVYKARKVIIIGKDKDFILAIF